MATVNPRTARISLSVARWRFSTIVGPVQVWPKSVDFITAIEELLFCRNEAQTVFPSTGSTAICESYCPPTTGSGSMGVGTVQVRPRSLEICSNTCNAHELQLVWPATS